MKIKAQDPSFGDGEEITLTGLNALLPNNQEVELDDELVAEYESRTGRKLADVIATSKRFGGTPAPKPAQEDEVVAPTPPVQVLEVEPPKVKTEKDDEGGEKN